jgi:hypothetical protein
MKLRHAAALALVGWYLMFAPTGSDDFPNIKAPLSTWQQRHSYDKASECEDDKVKSIDSLVSDFAKKHPDEVAQWPPGWSDPLCIATDDPRLKGN